MNVARIALLGVALVAAGGAAFLARSLTHKAPSAKPAAVEASSTQVLVASHALEPGAVLSSSDLRWQKWPADAVTVSYFSQKGAGAPPEEVVGAMVRMHLEPGEPLTRTKVVKGKDAGFMAVMLAPGMRAVSIKISEESAAGGFVLPGDKVDVIAVRKVEDAGSEAQYSAQTVLESVRVLAIGQTFEQSSDDKSIVAKTATLELTQGQAELVTAAQAGGDLSISLRAAAGGEVTAAIKPARRLSDSIRVVRYGHVSRATPALSGGSTP